MRQAKMSFDMWGALSPLSAKAPPGSAEKTPDLPADEKSDPLSEKRTMSQAELESTLYKVIFVVYEEIVLLTHFFFSMMELLQIT